MSADTHRLRRTQPTALLDLDAVDVPKPDRSNTLLGFALTMALGAVAGFLLGLSPAGTLFLAGLDWLDAVPK